MTTRDKALGIGMLLPAVLLLAAALATGTTPLELPPPVIDKPLQELPALFELPPLAADLPCEPPVLRPTERHTISAGTIVVQAIARDRMKLEGRLLNPGELVRALARLADADRDESSPNQVSNRRLVVFAGPRLPYRAVIPVLLAAIHQDVRIHDLSVAEPGRKPVAITMLPEWLPDADGHRTEIERVATLEVELKRTRTEPVSRVKLLDSALGSGQEAFAKLERQCAKIRGMEGNGDVPAEVFAWHWVPVAEVLYSMRMLWRLGYPGVSLLRLRPELMIPDEWLSLGERANRLEGAKRTGFLLDDLWESGDPNRNESLPLLREDGLISARAILTRLAEQGPPKTDRGQLMQTEIGLVTPTALLLYRFGEAVVPDLLTATASSSALVRIRAIEALRGFKSVSPAVEEAMYRMWMFDEDRMARQAGELAFKAVRPRPPLPAPD